MAEQKNTERNGSWNEDGFSNDVLSSFRSDEQSGAREQKLDSGSREAGDSGSLSGQSLTYGKDSNITDEQDASKQAGKKPKHFHFIWIPCIFIFIGFYFFLFIAGNHNGDKEDSDDRGHYSYPDRQENVPEQDTLFTEARVTPEDGDHDYEVIIDVSDIEGLCASEQDYWSSAYFDFDWVSISLYAFRYSHVASSDEIDAAVESEMNTFEGILEMEEKDRGQFSFDMCDVYYVALGPEGTPKPGNDFYFYDIWINPPGYAGFEIFINFEYASTAEGFDPKAFLNDHLTIKEPELFTKARVWTEDGNYTAKIDVSDQEGLWQSKQESESSVYFLFDQEQIYLDASKLGSVSPYGDYESYNSFLESFSGIEEKDRGEFSWEMCKVYYLLYEPKTDSELKLDFLQSHILIYTPDRTRFLLEIVIYPPSTAEEFNPESFLEDHLTIKKI